MSIFEFLLRLPFWIASRILYLTIWAILMFIPFAFLFGCVGMFGGPDLFVPGNEAAVVFWPAIFYFIVCFFRTLYYIHKAWLQRETSGRQDLGRNILNVWTWRFSDRAPTLENWYRTRQRSF